MAQPLVLVIDLGDAFTKVVLATRPRPIRRRFPSVVARRLSEPTTAGRTPASDASGRGMRQGDAAGSERDGDPLVLGGVGALLRPEGFDASLYPPARSYPGGAALRRAVEPPREARFAGWMATKLGADRQLLGLHPSEANVDALVHKALMELPAHARLIRLLLLLDHGPKAAAIQRYASVSPRTEKFYAWRVGAAAPQLLELRLEPELVDLADAVQASLPAALAPEPGSLLAVLDVGYLRAKLALCSVEGCERQEELGGLGLADCVRRVLRDGQDQGLIEDEFAVIKALESSQAELEIAGRRYRVGAIVESARQALIEGLTRATERVALKHYARHGLAITRLALVGGGAPVLGEGLRRALLESQLGLRTVWIATEPSFGAALGAMQRVAVR